MAIRAGYKALTDKEIESIKQTQKTVDTIKCTKSVEGDYILKASVDSEGNVTYTWESET